MDWQAWVTVAVVVCIFVALVRDWAAPDMLFIGAAAFFALVGIIDAEAAFDGFANSALITVAMLFAVASALRETGVLDSIGHYVLGKARTQRGALTRLSGVVLPMSAFLNNTPIVAMFVPIVLDWCRRNDIAPSKLLIPLSYLTILGGTCTLIGTSTNLVVHGLMTDRGIAGIGMFELSKIGLPYAVIGCIYIYFFAGRLLPERKELLEQLGESRREFLVEMIVTPGCRLIGQGVETAGLRQLSGLFLVEIDRDGRTISPVGPEEIIESNDRLEFTGLVENIIDLEKIPGLIPATAHDVEAQPKAEPDGRLCEAVISESSPLIGKTIREADFRAAYNAVVVAVHRSGARVERKVGDIQLRPGDTLLMQTTPHFRRAHRNDPAFYLISDVENYRPLRRDRAWISIAIFAVLLVAMTTGYIPIVVAAALAAVLMVATGCISAGEARRSIDWQVLLTIGGAYAVGLALENSGVAHVVVESILGGGGAANPWIMLAVIYVLGSIVTEMITNNAAAILIFPFCLETAKACDADARPFLVALVMAASASFMTPIGYQTNMMVYGPGGYRFTDYVRIGGPLHLVLICVAVTFIPLIWPF